MAFIRRVRTGSGATAVQIAEYVSGRRQRIVAHLGSAHSDVELGVLVARAQEMLDDAAQGELDLGLAKVTRRARLAPPPADPALFTPAAAPGARRVTAEVVAAGSVVATASALLFDLLDGIYASLGFDALDDEAFRDLVLARVVEPTSLLDVGRVLADMGRQSASYPTLWRTRAAPPRPTAPTARTPSSPEWTRSCQPTRAVVPRSAPTGTGSPISASRTR